MAYQEINRSFEESVKGIDESLLSKKEAWYRYVADLPKHLRVTYTILILHKQVYNGGFHQYFYNSFAQFAYITLESLDEIKANKTKILLAKVLQAVNAEELEIDEYRERVYNRKFDFISNPDNDLCDFLNACDGEYYDMEEDILQLLSEYLSHYK